MNPSAVNPDRLVTPRGLQFGLQGGTWELLERPGADPTRWGTAPLLECPPGEHKATAHAQHLCCEAPGSVAKRARMLELLLSQQQAGRVVVLARRAEATTLSGHAALRRLLVLQEQMAAEEQQEALGLFKALPKQILLTTDRALEAVELPPVQLLAHMWLDSPKM